MTSVPRTAGTRCADCDRNLGSGTSCNDGIFELARDMHINRHAPAGEEVSASTSAGIC